MDLSFGIRVGRKGAKPWTWKPNPRSDYRLSDGKYFTSQNAEYVVGGIQDSVDECGEQCHPDSICVQRGNISNCECKAGYEGNGKNCTDINECERNNGGCMNICINTPGSSSCVCGDGFKEMSGSEDCQDINECENPLTNQCDKHAECINTVGSYYCKCNDFYTGNGTHCEECSCPPQSNETMNANNSMSWPSCPYTKGYLISDNQSFQNDSNARWVFNLSQNDVGVHKYTGMRFYVLNLMESETDLSIGCGPLPSEQPKVTFYGLDIPPGTTKEFYLECEQLWAKLASSSSQSSVGMKVWYEMDINECLDLCVCPDDAECVDVDGSFQCLCHPGFKRIGGECIENVCPYVTIPPFNGVYQRSYCSQTSGFLLSPSYPAEYTSNEDVAWWMNLTNSEAIQFNLLNFSTEAKQDFFYIFNSSLMNSSYIEYEISGKTGSLQDTHFQNQMAEVADILHLKRPADDDSIATRFISDRAHNGYFKIFFQKDGNECADDPCQHGGTCMDVEFGFNCICNAGYHGQYCEQEFTEVVSLRCTTMCTKVLLQWEMNAESLPIQNFRVAYGRIDQNCVSVNRTSGSANEIILSNLTPYQEYLIDVIADVYTGQTEGKSCMVKTTCFGECHKALENVTLSLVSSDSATIQWEPPLMGMSFGNPGNMYIIYHKEPYDDTGVTAVSVPITSSKITIKGLQSNTSYRICSRSHFPEIICPPNTGVLLRTLAGKSFHFEED
ncbi:protein jagged-1-like [Polypterus senegalus]|uniref:protein jagged-1-like n=1 Tax=Polypterus senegalus TaxID=55291 RepID=UPI001965EB22|nr:protein jagged-1-like [Polypterus senegalus]